MRVYQFVGAAVLLGPLLAALLHLRLHGRLSPLQIACAFFCNLNMLVSLWEIALGAHVAHIRQEFITLKERFKGNEFAAVTEFFLLPLGWADALSLKFWYGRGGEQGALLLMPS